MLNKGQGLLTAIIFIIAGFFLIGAADARGSKARSSDSQEYHLTCNH